MDERVKTAFSFAADSTKQVITLSTAIVALTVTFAKDVFDEASSLETTVLVIAWVIYLFSIIAGIWTLLALTGTLEPATKTRDASIRGRNVTIPAIAQMATFLLATALIVLYGILAIT